MPGEEISHAPLCVRGDPSLQIVGCGDGPETENRMILTKRCGNGNLVRAVNDLGEAGDKIGWKKGLSMGRVAICEASR